MLLNVVATVEEEEEKPNITNTPASPPALPPSPEPSLQPKKRKSRKSRKKRKTNTAREEPEGIVVENDFVEGDETDAEDHWTNYNWTTCHKTILPYPDEFPYFVGIDDHSVYWKNDPRTKLAWHAWQHSYSMVVGILTRGVQPVPFHFWEHLADSRKMIIDEYINRWPTDPNPPSVSTFVPFQSEAHYVNDYFYPNTYPEGGPTLDDFRVR